jgi:SAM-dependent methyltransferase
MLRAWRDWPLAMDFLDPSSSNFHWKSAQFRLYSALLAEILPGLDGRPVDKPLRILDAACGIGRFALPLLRAGHQVDALDGCRPSLDALSRHAAAAAAASHAATDSPLLSRLRLVHGDVDEVPAEPFRADSYDVVLAIELLCYVPEPRATARALASRLRPGGLFIASVEAWPGALLSDPSGLTLNDLESVLHSHVLAVRDERHVRAFDAVGAAAILHAAFLGLRWIRGTHWLPDGPLQALLDPEELAEEGAMARLLRMEELLRREPALVGLPRALVMVADRVRDSR